MHSFVYGLLGGALIGLAASVLLLFSGDILGASGIVSSIGLAPISSIQNPRQHWKIVFIAAFFLSSHLFFASEYEDKDGGLASLSWAAYLIGGLLVGFGTRLGNGCTSGHGICGLARFSKRSMAAVMTFMSIGIITAYFTQQATTPFGDSAFAFLRDDSQEPVRVWDKAGAVLSMFLAFVALVAAAFHPISETEDVNTRRKLAPAAIVGILFAAGLYVSQMVYPVRVMGFLNVGLIPQGDWDATLMFVMGGGMTLSFLAYQFVEGFQLFKGGPSPLAKPLALTEGSEFCVPSNTIIDRDLVLGAMCFGMGWGISGLCPGPAMFLASIGVSWVLVCYWPAFFVGAYIASLVKGKTIPSCFPTSSSSSDSKNDSHSTTDLEKAKDGLEKAEETVANDLCDTAVFDDLDEESGGITTRATTATISQTAEAEHPSLAFVDV
ncbi:UPF0394 membrane protein [Seminavis robusta]|uniref:UPF0394 membrane protein n=1 Tax=Seminavis robusta TaxID=568900 RepID=A0A9N8DBT4_9STRA|nr:UPF0394 membrane protein [Seminavis robusta]|eukprot:Sro76_g041570.1 UPF0394 membrane protein (437) ;mRNA; r:42737-44047